MTDNRSFYEKAKDAFAPSVISGLTGAVGAFAIFGIGSSDTVTFGNMEMNALLAVTLGVGGAVLWTEVIQDVVFENISVLKPLGQYEANVGGPVLAGLSTFIIFKAGLSSKPKMWDMIGLGAGSAVLGKYIYNDVIHPMGYF